MRNLALILDNRFENKSVCTNISLLKPSELLPPNSVVIHQDIDLYVLLSAVTSTMSSQASIDTEKDSHIVSKICFDVTAIAVDVDLTSALEDLANAYTSSDKTIFSIYHNQSLYAVKYDEECDNYICDCVCYMNFDPSHLNNFYFAIFGQNAPNYLLELHEDYAIAITVQKTVLFDVISLVDQALKTEQIAVVDVDEDDENVICLFDSTGGHESLTIKQLVAVIKESMTQIDEELDAGQAQDSLYNHNNNIQSLDVSLFSQDTSQEAESLDADILEIELKISACMQRGTSQSAIKLCQVQRNESWMDGEYLDALRTLYNLENEQLEKSRKSEVIISRLQRNLKEQEVIADDLQQSLSRLVQEVWCCD